MINGTKQSRLCAVKSSAEERQRSFFKGMTIYEILDVLGGSRVTTYKKLNRLVKLGYVEKGCKDINADTYLLTAKGIGLIKESEHGGKENVKE